jgi:hypothetical protein
MLVDAREGYDVIPRDDTWLRERAESVEDRFEG